MWRPGHRNARSLAIARHKRGISADYQRHFALMDPLCERSGSRLGRCPDRVGGSRSKRIINHRRLISLSMGTRPSDAEKATRALRERQPLLAAWLDALNRFDNPMRRRAANFREHSRLRRDIDPIRGLHTRDISSDLAGPAPGFTHPATALHCTSPRGSGST